MLATMNCGDWHTVVGMELCGEANDVLSQQAGTALAEE